MVTGNYIKCEKNLPHVLTIRSHTLCVQDKNIFLSINIYALSMKTHSPRPDCKYMCFSNNIVMDFRQ